MKVILALFCLFPLIVSTHSWGAVTLTSFGSSDFAVEDPGGFTTFSFNQTASNLNVFGTDNQQLVGTFAAKDISGQSDFLTLTGSTTVAPASGFTVELVDSSFRTATYIGGAWSGLTGGSTTLSFSSSQVGFDFTDVFAIQLFGGGVGSNVNATLTGASTFSAIPEPSRIVLMAIGCGGLLLRRRRSVRV